MTVRMFLKAVREMIRNFGKNKKLMEATRMWMDAKDEAENLRRLDGHRYFVIYDPGQKKLIPITYDIYKNRGNSYQYLRQRGRFKRPLRREELKKLCFYYTTSQWTTAPITEAEKQEKLVLWQRYYTGHA